MVMNDLSKEEIKSAIAQGFLSREAVDRLDNDHDGIVSKHELKTGTMMPNVSTYLANSFGLMWLQASIWLSNVIFLGSLFFALCTDCAKLV